MKNSVAVVAPHPDDETIGCGGTLLRLRREGAKTHWIIMTALSASAGYTAAQRRGRAKEIAKVAKLFGFVSVHELGYPTTGLDGVPFGGIVGGLSRLFAHTSPDIVLAPHGGDAHSDHRVTFSAVMAAAKTFRHPYVKRVLTYETVSETEFAPPLASSAFLPNSFSDISGFLDRKLAVFSVYKGEQGKHPFPRSRDNVRALASFRGASAGYQYAEAFAVMKERW